MQQTLLTRRQLLEEGYTVRSSMSHLCVPQRPFEADVCTVEIGDYEVRIHCNSSEPDLAITSRPETLLFWVLNLQTLSSLSCDKFVKKLDDLRASYTQGLFDHGCPIFVYNHRNKAQGRKDWPYAMKGALGNGMRHWIAREHSWLVMACADSVGNKLMSLVWMHVFAIRRMNALSSPPKDRGSGDSRAVHAASSSSKPNDCPARSSGDLRGAQATSLSTTTSHTSLDKVRSIGSRLVQRVRPSSRKQGSPDSEARTSILTQPRNRPDTHPTERLVYDKGGEEPLPQYTVRNGPESHRDLLAPMSRDRPMTPYRGQDLVPTVYYPSREVGRFDRQRTFLETVTETQESEDEGWNRYFVDHHQVTGQACAEPPVENWI